MPPDFLSLVREVCSAVTSDTEESSGVMRGTSTPHEQMESSETSLTQCSSTNEAVWAACVLHHLRSGTSPKCFGCCEALSAVCTECPVLVTAMESHRELPAGFQNGKKYHRQDCVLKGGSWIMSHMEPWGRCSQGLGGRNQPQVSPRVVTLQEHSAPALGWDCCAASLGATAQESTTRFSPLVFGKIK